MAKEEKEKPTITDFKRHIRDNAKAIRAMKVMAAKNGTLKKSMAEPLKALEEENSKIIETACNFFKKELEEIVNED